MEIQLPEVQSYLEKIKNGSITNIRLPNTEVKPGSVLAAYSPAEGDTAIKLKVLSSETVPLEAVTAGEAEQEGFTAPDFCSSRFLCESIETRLDFEDYAFKDEGGIKTARPEAEREDLLKEKVARLCPSCITRKSAKDLFLRYWKPKVSDGTMTKITFEVMY
jgi:uncharacterized protein YqfB (UPF0267 family)